MLCITLLLLSLTCLGHASPPPPPFPPYPVKGQPPRPRPPLSPPKPPPRPKPPPSPPRPRPRPPRPSSRPPPSPASSVRSPPPIPPTPPTPYSPPSLPPTIFRSPSPPPTSYLPPPPSPTSNRRPPPPSPTNNRPPTSPPPVPPSPPANTSMCTATVPASIFTIPVPPSFIGLSHEPMSMAKSILPTPQYGALIALLSSFDTGPFIIRWGGGTQDRLGTVLIESNWQAMADLHVATGCKYMIALNLLAQNASLAVAQATAAMAILPPEAVVAFNIGNEPDIFYKLHGFPSNYFTTTWFSDMAMYTAALKPLLLKYFGTQKMVSGPATSWTVYGWGSSNSTMAKFVAPTSPLAPYINMLTAHFYPAMATVKGTTTATFLAENKMDLAVTKAAPWVAWGATYGLPFRIEETNTLCIGGLAGASNTLGAALYNVDYALRMLQTGVDGLNFHDSVCYSYSPILMPSLCAPAAPFGPTITTGQGAGCPATCGKTGAAGAPSINAPFYGMLLTQMALRGLPSLVKGVTLQGCSDPNIRVYALSANDGEEMRVVLVKKNGTSAAAVTVSIAGYYGTGSLSLLTGPSVTSLVQNITLAGQQVDNMGNMTGPLTLQTVSVTHVAGESSQYAVKLPAFSAALMILQRLVL